MTRAAVLVALTLIFAGASHAQVPELEGRVMDRADLLAPETEALLDRLLTAHEDSTGNQIVVLIIPSLNGRDLEEYSLEVARSWGLGTAENDDGVLFLVAALDREMRIEVGYGLEGALTDATAARILRNEVRPRFREGDFDNGVLMGTQAIVSAVQGEYDAGSAERPPRAFGLLFLVLPMLFAFFGTITPGCMRYALMVFLIPFFAASGFMLTGSPAGMAIFVGVYLVAFILVSRLPAFQLARDSLARGKKAKVGPFSISPSSSGSGGWSSSGGGFSGGGGSFGGGGASSSW